MTHALPTPPAEWSAAWAASLVQSLMSRFLRVDDQVTVLELKASQAGRLQLTVAALPKIGEILANGAVYNKTDMPDLAKACGTTFNTGGETTNQFRIPNLATPLAGLEWRISTGA